MYVEDIPAANKLWPASLPPVHNATSTTTRSQHTAQKGGSSIASTPMPRHNGRPKTTAAAAVLKQRRDVDVTFFSNTVKLYLHNVMIKANELLSRELLSSLMVMNHRQSLETRYMDHAKVLHESQSRRPRPLQSALTIEASNKSEFLVQAYRLVVADAKLPEKQRRLNHPAQVSVPRSGGGTVLINPSRNLSLYINDVIFSPFGSLWESSFTLATELTHDRILEKEVQQLVVILRGNDALSFEGVACKLLYSELLPADTAHIFVNNVRDGVDKDVCREIAHAWGLEETEVLRRIESSRAESNQGTRDPLVEALDQHPNTILCNSYSWLQFAATELIADVSSTPSPVDPIFQSLRLGVQYLQQVNENQTATLYPKEGYLHQFTFLTLVEKYLAATLVYAESGNVNWCGGVVLPKQLAEDLHRRHSVLFRPYLTGYQINLSVHVITPITPSPLLCISNVPLFRK